MHATGSRSRRCHSVTASIALVLMLSGLACATGSGRANETISALTVLDFENSSLDPVAVYLAAQRSEWLLGYVEPRRRAHLRLPDHFTGSNYDVTIIVAPVGSQRHGVLARDITDAICMESVPTDELSSMRWTLNGRQLMSFVPPKQR
jgi:hypothetical protein